MEEKIINLIADKLGKKKESKKMDSHLVEDLGADSLDVVELVMALEEKFDINVPDEDAEKISTVGDIVAYIEKAKN